MTIASDNWAADVVLTDGATLHVRAMRPDDAPALGRMFERLSAQSLYLRFFSTVSRSNATTLEMRHTPGVPYASMVALLGAEVVGAARYDVVTPGVAEIAFVVDDEHQGRGIATLLLEHLAVIARAHGVHSFAADTLPENAKMLNVFARAGWRRTSRFDRGTVRTHLDITPSAASDAVIAAREHTAEAASIARLLEPATVAVVGASTHPGKIGNAVVRNLLDFDFRGAVYAVNPSATAVEGLPTYASLDEVPGAVDLVIVVRPAAEVLDIVEQAARKGAKGLVVLASGFAEAGPDGRALQQALVAAARGNGMRVVGPNCLGVVNTVAGVRLDATFAPSLPVPGNVAFLSQSGGLGIEILSQASGRGLGVSQFVSVGNKCDVSGNDLLQFWEDDPATEVVLMYLESFGNPRKFARIARRISQRKPIIAVKSGRTPAGTRGATSHTAALAASDVAVDALFRQTGVVRVDTLEELLDTAQFLSAQPVPAGPRVAIIGNAGGPGILAADACVGAGLVVDPFSEATAAALRAAAPGASIANPIDLGAAATPAVFAAALPVVLAADEVDAVLVIYAPPVVTAPLDVARAVADSVAVTGNAKPVAACFLARAEVAEALRGDATRRSIPAFPFPETAARALGRAAELGAWRARAVGSVPVLDRVDADTARSLVIERLRDTPDGAWLEWSECAAVLGAFGLSVVESRTASGAKDAMRLSEELGFPVALKARATGVLHKSDVGGVALALDDPEAVETAYASMQRRIGDAMHGAIVQRMAGPGLEVIVGITQDALFGPLLLLGLGGVNAELLADRSLRVLPLTDVDAHELVRSLRSSPLLFGYRGAPPLDVDALEDLLHRVARLATEVPEITEMDLNPVVVHEHGVTVVDVRARCMPTAAVYPSDLRRMRD